MLVKNILFTKKISEKNQNQEMMTMKDFVSTLSETSFPSPS